MTWSEDYERKRVSAAQALEAVTSGARVWIQSGCGTPSILVDALVGRAASLRNLVALFGGGYPAWRATQLTPVEGLSHE